MSEQYRFYWDNEGNGFPEVCQQTCSALWEAALRLKPDDVDMFEDGCGSMSGDYGGTSLQGRPDSSKRYVGVLTTCGEHNTDAFAELYSFDCPNV
jgi:hypothetical protein